MAPAFNGLCGTRDARAAHAQGDEPFDEDRTSPVNVRAMTPSDLTGTMKPDELFVGRKVHVRAWWTNFRKLVECEVVQVFAPTACGRSLLVVRPLTGNSHLRGIDIRLIVY